MKETKCICNGEIKCLYHQLPPENVKMFEDAMSPQPKEEWEERFDKKFGKTVTDETGYKYSEGESAGCDDCTINVNERDEHKKFCEEEIKVAFLAGQKQEREKYEDIFKWLLGEEGEFPDLSQKPHYSFRTELRKRLSATEPKS